MKLTRLSVFVLAALLSGLRAMGADFFYNGIMYSTLVNNEASVVSYDINAALGHLVLPEQVTYQGKSYPVTMIESYAFQNCFSLSSITVPEGVTEIGMNAFENCGCLNAVSLPESLRSIGNAAFRDCCSLEAMNLPLNTTIGYSVFDNCFCLPQADGVLYAGNAVVGVTDPGLTACAVREGTESIVNGAFSSCSSLKSISIPETVVKVGPDAFTGCNSLPVTDGCRYADRILIQVVNRNLTSYSIKSGTKVIIDNAFQNCTAMTSLSLPDGLVSIGQRAFAGCSALTSVLIPNTVSFVGIEAFRDCRKLTEANIPTISASVPEGMFYGCSALKSVKMHDRITSIGTDAFAKCTSLTSLVIPNAVKVISLDFNGCSALQSLTYADDVVCTYIDFYGCSSLVELKVPRNITAVPASCFAGCTSLTSVKLPDGVTSIGAAAFKNCSSLASINIPEGVKSVPSDAFSGCSSLPVYDNCRYAGPFLIAAASKSITSCTVKEGTLSIAGGAFSGCSALASVSIPESVVTIAQSAFDGCTSLPVYDNCRYADCFLIGAVDKSCVSYTIKEGTRFIGPGAFMECENLASVVIPEGVVSIGDNAFYSCYSLESVSLPGTLKTIGSDAFGWCFLEYVSIPQSVEYIDTRAFGDNVIETFVITSDQPVYGGRYLTYSEGFSAVLISPIGWYGKYSEYNGSYWYDMGLHRDFASSVDQLSADCTYMMLNAGTGRFLGRSGYIDASFRKAETVKDNCWMLVCTDGGYCLYNVGAKQFAKVADGEIVLSDRMEYVTVKEQGAAMYIDGMSQGFYFVVNTRVDADAEITRLDTEVIGVAEGQPAVTGIYDLQGRPAVQTAGGVYIMRYSDGTARKVTFE